MNQDSIDFKILYDLFYISAHHSVFIDPRVKTPVVSHGTVVCL